MVLHRSCISRLRAALILTIAGLVLSPPSIAEEDWPRWLAIDPDFDPDYENWLRKSERAMKEHADQPYVLEKVMVDPDEFLEWSRMNVGGKVGQSARGQYAGFVLMEKHRTDH